MQARTESDPFDTTIETLSLDIAGELEQLARHEQDVVRRRRQLRAQRMTAEALEEAQASRQRPAVPRAKARPRVVRAAPTRPSLWARVLRWLKRG